MDKIIWKPNHVTFLHFSDYKGKADAVAAFGTGFIRDFTDCCSQSKAIASTAALIALQYHTPLVLVGQRVKIEKDKTIEDIWEFKESEAMWRYLFGIYARKERWLVDNIYRRDGLSFYEKAEKLFELIRIREWQTIIVVCHNDQIARLKKLFKFFSFVNDLKINIIFAGIWPAYDWSHEFWFRRRQWRSKLWEKAAILFNMFAR